MIFDVYVDYQTIILKSREEFKFSLFKSYKAILIKYDIHYNKIGRKRIGIKLLKRQVKDMVDEIEDIFSEAYFDISFDSSKIDLKLLRLKDIEINKYYLRYCEMDDETLKMIRDVC